MYESKRAYHYGTGRRKASVARVRVYENGTGSITINGRDIDEYFGLETLKLIVRQPPEHHRHHRQGGHYLHRRGRRRYRSGRRHPSRRGPRPAGREPRVPRRAQGRRPADPRPQNEGAQEVRSQGSPSRTSVQQALIETSKCPKTPEPCGFPGFFFLSCSGST